MNKKSSTTLFKQIVEYKPTASESEREDQRQKDIIALNERINKLTAEGNTLLKGVTAGMMLEGDFRGADRVRAIQREIRTLNHEVKMLSRMPIQDDAYIAVCSELDAVIAERKAVEERYNKAIAEHEDSMGKIPFDRFQSLTREMYDLSAELEELRKREKELSELKNQYNRKTDQLYWDYLEAKDAEVKEFVLEHVKAVADYLAKAKEERDTAEKITYARKGKRVPELCMVPFGGDTLRQMLKYCDEIIALVGE